MYVRVEKGRDVKGGEVAMGGEMDLHGGVNGWILLLREKKRHVREDNGEG